MFLVSFVIGGKRIIVEMITVIQFAYVSLIAVPQLSPLFSALTALSYANNGYNILYDPSLRPFEDVIGS